MQSFIDDLKKLLQQDIVDLSNLKAILEQEKRTLTTRDTPKIDLLAQTKSQTINQLESRAKLKAKLLASSGLGVRPGQVEEKLVSLNDSELMTLWHSTRSELAACQAQNQVNGSIIAQSQQRVAKLMTIIRGQTKAPNLYGQRGKTESYQSSHRIGKA